MAAFSVTLVNKFKIFYQLPSNCQSLLTLVFFYKIFLDICFNILHKNLSLDECVMIIIEEIFFFLDFELIFLSKLYFLKNVSYI